MAIPTSSAGSEPRPRSFGLAKIGPFHRLKTRLTKFKKHLRQALAPNRYYYLTPNKSLVRTVSGSLIYVDPCDETVSANLIAHGYWEPDITSVVRKLSFPGATIVEVGANLGYFTIEMALKAGHEGRVISFEANPVMADFVRKSTIINGLTDRIMIIEKAASDHEGHLEFMTSRQYGGSGHILVEESGIGPDQTIIRVETQTLDALDIPHADFIRIDAEGSEPLVLRGAQRLLNHTNVVVCMEWSPIQMRSRADVAEFANWLAEQGFKFWRIEPEGRLSPVDASLLAEMAHCELVMARHTPPLPLKA